MRGLFLVLLKKVRSVENWIFKTLTKHLSGKGLGKIPGISKIGKVRQGFYDKSFDSIKPEGETVVDVFGKKMIVDPASSEIASMLIMDGSMEDFDTEVFLDRIKKDYVVIDIGANIGYFTLIAAEKVGDGGKVIAFEPEPGSFSYLERNVKLNGFENVVLSNKALSNNCGSTRLWFSESEKLTASFSKENAGDLTTEKKIEKIESVEVDTITLDDFVEEQGIQKVDFIKMDVEGAEGLVLEGAKKLLKQDLTILMEFRPYALKNMGTDPQKLIKWLTNEYGFTIRFINQRKQNLVPINEIEYSNSDKDLGEGFNILLEKKR